MSLTKRLILALAMMAGLSPAFAQAPPPVPALPDSERRTSYSISGTNCTCAVGFQLYADSSDVANWLEVFINGVRANFNDPSFGWAITSPTGSIASIPRPITDAVLTFTNVQTGTIQIVGARRPRRTTTFQESQPVPTRNFNQVFNDLTAMLREDWDKINDVSGRAILAAPGETLALLPAAATRANQGACFDNGGNLVNCVSVPSTTFTAGNGIVFTGVGPTSIKANLAAGPNVTITGTNPLSINVPLAAGPGITLTGSNPLTISASNAVFATRTSAAAQNLTGLTTIQTLGYSTSGDGGGATFTNVGSAPFIDSYIATATLTGGSAYTTGSYLDVRLTGGTGRFCNVGATVAGGAVTVISQATPCVGYTVGDVLTVANTVLGGTGSGFHWNVATLSTPQASFTDTGGNHWQYTPNGPTNLYQFGCKGDWNGTDAGATNNSPCIWSALAWASVIPTPTYLFSSQGGNQIIIPKGAFMTCGLDRYPSANFVIPNSVQLVGVATFASVLVECAADAPGNSHYIQLCDVYVGSGQFGCKVSNFTLQLTQAGGTTGTSALHSVSGQQFALAENMEMTVGKRSCVGYEIGIGGAANDIWIGMDCTQSSIAIGAAYLFNSATAHHILQRSLCGSVPAGALICIQNLGGRLAADGIDIEGFVVGLDQNVSVAGVISSYRNVQEQSLSCTDAIKLEAGNTANNILIENISTGCPVTVHNLPSGVNTTGNILKQVLCPGAGACN